MFVTSKQRKCCNDPDIFCYICGCFTLSPQRRNINSFIKKIYLAYFGVPLGDQEESRAPHQVCTTCVEALKSWSSTSSTNSDDDDEEQDIAHEAWNSGRLSLYSQFELNDLIRDLNLPKQSAEVLASRLQEKHLPKAGTSVSFYRNPEKKLRKYFQSDGQLVYCIDVDGLLLAMGLSAYHLNDWRLFIDSSKRSLKCVLLHNGNQYGSIPIGQGFSKFYCYGAHEEVDHYLRSPTINL